MILARIDGGLGNQMFQYAYGLYLARRNDTQLLLDLTSFEAGPAHGYLLDRFQIEAPIADAACLSRRPRRYRGEFLPAAWWQQIGIGNLRRHKENPFGFHDRHLRVPDQRYLVGYWQSQQFFPGMRPELLRQFQLAHPLSAPSQRVSERIQSTNSAVIHLRRGDYLSNPQASKLYAHLELDYYLGSLTDWAARRDQIEVFVFSNDMDWCKRHVRLPWTTHWVDHNDASTAHEDLVLMSQAACCIIANSTFSWWAAWLNQRPQHCVYAPPSWFRPGQLDDRHIVCPQWQRIRRQSQAA